MKLTNEELIAYATVAFCEIRKIEEIIDNAIANLERKEMNKKSTETI
jgi:hypothetical protein